MGSARAQLEKLCENILEKQTERSYNFRLWCHSDGTRGAARRYETNFTACEDALKPLLEQLKDLKCEGKDERVATLRESILKLPHYNQQLIV